MGPPHKDRTGVTYGYWTALKLAPARKGNTYWLCRCECGTVREVSGGALGNGAAKSCGCRKSAPVRRPETMAGQRSKWIHLKDEALRRYAAGAFLTDIKRDLGIAYNTMVRWARAAGIARTASKSKAMQVARKPGGARHLGKSCAFNGAKIGWLSADSTYELARLVQLEADPLVASVARCEDAIPYEFGGRERHYNPDLFVTGTDGAARVEEIKPARFLTQPKTAAKIAAGRAFYVAMEFRVVTEVEIGLEAIAAAGAAWISVQDPAYLAELKERRRLQRCRAQRRVHRKLMASLDADGMAAFRRRAAAYTRAARLRKLAAATL